MAQGLGVEWGSPLGIHIHVLQSKVCAEVDHLNVTRQLIDDDLCRGMRQAAECSVHTGPVHVARLHKGGHIPGRQQVGEHLVELLPARKEWCTDVSDGDQRQRSAPRVKG